jgi:hypothetical protein
MVLLASLGLSACTGLKHASEQRPVFSSFEVEFTEPPEVEPSAARAELQGLVNPDPNTSIFGMRPTVALHNMTKEPRRPNKGIRNLLKYKIGSAPVYLDQVPLDDIVAAMENRMHNRGYFAARASHRVVPHGKTASVIFTVAPGLPHRLRHITYADSSAQADTLDHRIHLALSQATLAPGDAYHLARLVTERTRVAGTLRNSGYYRLNADDLVFVADTTVGDRQVDIHLRVKNETGPAERRRYYVGEVYVHGDHDLLLPPGDTTLVDSVLYIDYLNMYRPSTITRGVFVEPGKPFSQRRTDQTQQYLSSYGVFSSVKVDYTEDSTEVGLMHADVFISPMKRFSLFSELNAVSKSNNFAGPGLKVGFKDRDLFRGAELLTVDLNTRFETQFAGEGKGTNAYEVGGKATLSVPRILVFNFLRSARSYVPVTRFEAGYGLFRRIGLYGLESANLAYSYVWRQNLRVWHDLRVPDVSYNNLYFTSPEFDEFLSENPAILRSFEEQFIIGASYTYTRSTQKRMADRSWFLMIFGVDEGGNLLSLMARGARPEEGYTLFGQRYSQFVRLRPELRWFRTVGNGGSQVAARVLTSAAVAYGNSSAVPYVKQFFSGGTNSVRAFRARSIGPGTFTSTSESNVLIDQVGDIKFEANLEYRFTLSGFVKAAFFADAGNVWLLRDDPQRPGGQFNIETAVDELAVGAGFGIRFDPEVIVVRLDLATPLRRPDLPAGDRWVFDDQYAKLGDNFILNIAIGYPF